MSLLTTLRKDKMQALKDKDTVKNGICSLLISAIALAEKEAGQPLSAEEELAYVQKELKQTKDTLAQTPASRPELIAETQRKIEIIEAYLPAQMSEAGLDDALRDRGASAGTGNEKQRNADQRDDGALQRKNRREIRQCRCRARAELITGF